MFYSSWVICPSKRKTLICAKIYFPLFSLIKCKTFLLLFNFRFTKQLFCVDYIVFKTGNFWKICIYFYLQCFKRLNLFASVYYGSGSFNRLVICCKWHPLETFKTSTNMIWFSIFSRGGEWSLDMLPISFLTCI